MSSKAVATKKHSKKQIKQVLDDYTLACTSREMSLIGRKEVLTGKAKFGIFGDGKELPQLAMAKFFKKGDFRSGYYRDQTFMLAIGELSVQEFFAQVYANTDAKAEPNSAGRQMNSHFATRLIDEDGEWIDQTESKNTSADISPTAGQMARLLGLAQASTLYKNLDELKHLTKFSKGGREVAWGTIGDASTSEGIFWETLNAAGVLQVPMVISIWDDEYGISVSKKYQTVKESISTALRGFKRTKRQPGFEILTVKGWDYEALLDAYSRAESIAREEHVPVLVHVEEVTQPQGHSTSGSHERYKSDERLNWEKAHCCIKKFKEWILDQEIADEKELAKIEEKAAARVKKEQSLAWQKFQQPIQTEKDELLAILERVTEEHPEVDKIKKYKAKLSRISKVIRRDVMHTARRVQISLRGRESQSSKKLSDWIHQYSESNHERFSSHLYSETKYSPVHIEEVKPAYNDTSAKVDGRVVLRNNFDTLFEKYPNVVAFGEDVGKLGDVNLALVGLQEKYGELRVSDAGIREATIIGQGMGLALRGIRPIAEIQYLDYLLYGFQLLSDDVATLRYRTKGGQAYPLIIRTRGHRLEGIWHAGSPMGMIVNGLMGIHVCVPRNLTEAAGFYNTLLQGDDPALIVEPLNAYRLKEKLPENLGEFTVPLGVPEIVHEGTDITIVSYGSTFNVIESILPELAEMGISAELIDVRTLLPFDKNQMILESLKKTNRILFVDEDVPGGATAYMMRQVIDEQGGYNYLDSRAQCLSSQPHRTAYASDGDYFTKPNAEDILEKVYEIMSEANLGKYPVIPGI